MGKRVNETEKEYRCRIAVWTLCTRTPFLEVPRAFLYELTPNVAILLAVLGSFSVKLKTDNGWFHITQEQLKKETSLTRVQQKRCLNILAKKELIETAQSSTSGYAIYKINSDKVDKLILTFWDNYKGGGQ